jgi:hypothetical protein
MRRPGRPARLHAVLNARARKVGTRTGWPVGDVNTRPWLPWLAVLLHVAPERVCDRLRHWHGPTPSASLGGLLLPDTLDLNCCAAHGHGACRHVASAQRRSLANAQARMQAHPVPTSARARRNAASSFSQRAGYALPQRRLWQMNVARSALFRASS